MKTTEKLNSKYPLNRKTKLAQYALLVVFVIFLSGYEAYSQAAAPVITIKGNTTVKPLLERWVSEYSKTNPGYTFQLDDRNKTASADLSLVYNSSEAGGDDKISVKVGRYAVFPVTNDKNEGFSKEFKKGINLSELGNLFLKNRLAEEDEKGKKKQAVYTVYTKTPQSELAQAWAGFLGSKADELDGVYISGEDKYLTISVLQDSTGITYNNLGLIYDTDKRTPVSGIRILPVDLNGNGRLDKDEQIYDNLDQMLSFLENSNEVALPVDYICFTTNQKHVSDEVQNFINWVVEYGQDYNHQYGFLSAPLSPKLTYSGK